MTHQELLTAVNELLKSSTNASKKFSERYCYDLEHCKKIAIPIDELRAIDYALYENALMLNLLLKRLIKSKGVTNV
jgi:hypothetical protein